MAIWTSQEHSIETLEAFDHFFEKCIVNDGSILSSKELWTLSNVSELLKTFRDNFLTGDRTFYEKLAEQISNSRPEIKQLASEALWLLLLAPLYETIKVETKRQRIKEVWNLSGEPIPDHTWLNNRGLLGVGRSGTSFQTRIWQEFGYLLEVIVSWKIKDAANRLAIRKENPWDYADYLYRNFEFGSTSTFRRMLLYLMFPESFERIHSYKQKVAIFEAFKTRHGSKFLDVSDRPSNLDHNLLTIRNALINEFQNENIDFYREPLRSIWLDDSEINDTSVNQGSSWSEFEVSSVVDDYFVMLREQVEKKKINKTKHRNALMEKIKRSRGSIEFKHQNISSILFSLGFPHVDGYSPGRNNVQRLLADTVEEFLSINFEWLSPLETVIAEVDSKNLSLDEVFVMPPKSKEIGELKRTFKARKVDFAKRDESNRNLGHLGEKMVFELEQQRLREIGRDDLANNVRWDSRDQGDGLGYDIRSYNENGDELFIEVKTTRCGIDTGFFLSHNELECSRTNKSKYVLYRVFEFSLKPKIYKLHGALEDCLTLQPIAYRTHF